MEGLYTTLRESSTDRVSEALLGVELDTMGEHFVTAEDDVRQNLNMRSEVWLYFYLKIEFSASH